MSKSNIIYLEEGADKVVTPWTHWRNNKSARLFLAVDIPATIADTVILLEVKEYAEAEARIFEHILYSDWVTLTQDKKLLKPFTPKL